MKKILLALTVVAAGWLGATTPAEAGIFGHKKARVEIWVSGYAPCGDPIYVQRVFVGYDRYGDRVFETRVLPIVHHCYRPAPYRDGYGRDAYRHHDRDRDRDRDEWRGGWR